MLMILAIDPGPVQSGWCVVHADDAEPEEFGKDDNAEVLARIHNGGFGEFVDHVIIEMVASYGMPVGREVFETCVWIGRFHEALDRAGLEADLVTRNVVKNHHCHSPKANDATVRQALVDRYASGQPNHGKGTKANPGWFYGFHHDVWAAYALAVFAVDHCVPDTAASPWTEGPHLLQGGADRATLRN